MTSVNVSLMMTHDDDLLLIPEGRLLQNESVKESTASQLDGPDVLDLHLYFFELHHFLLQDAAGLEDLQTPCH